MWACEQGFTIKRVAEITRDNESKGWINRLNAGDRRLNWYNACKVEVYMITLDEKMFQCKNVLLRLMTVGLDCCDERVRFSTKLPHQAWLTSENRQSSICCLLRLVDILSDDSFHDYKLLFNAVAVADCFPLWVNIWRKWRRVQMNKKK